MGRKEDRGWAFEERRVTVRDPEAIIVGTSVTAESTLHQQADHAIAKGPGIRIWLDDQRKMPVGFFTHHAKSVVEVLALVKAHPVAAISFDHDLAPEHYATPPDYTRTQNGAHLAEILTGMAIAGALPELLWEAHSLRPEGKADIESWMRIARDAWEGISEAEGRPYAGWGPLDRDGAVTVLDRAPARS